MELTMSGRLSLISVWSCKAFFAVALGLATSLTYAQSSVWRWTVVAPSVTAIDYFAGNGKVEIDKTVVKAYLQEEKSRVDPFVFQGSITRQNQIIGSLKWPNSDAGDVEMKGQLRRFKQSDGSTYSMIWLLDSRTGIYLVLTQDTSKP